jgi:hypothetical protein
MFNTKRGSVTVYRSGWYSLLLTQASLLQATMSISSIQSKIVHITKATLYKFHFTIITSRSTSYLLFMFWLFFFFFGESLLLLVFNFTTPVDSINSFSFFNIKQHIIFLTDSLSSSLVNSINFYIYFLTSSAFLYLINLNYMTSYSYYWGNVTSSLLIFIIFILWL